MRQMMSVAEFQIVSGLGRTKIHEIMNAGLITRKKFGRRTLITKESAESFLGVKIDLPDHMSSRTETPPNAAEPKEINPKQTEPLTVTRTPPSQVR